MNPWTKAASAFQSVGASSTELNYAVAEFEYEVSAFKVEAELGYALGHLQNGSGEHVGEHDTPPATGPHEP